MTEAQRIAVRNLLTVLAEENAALRAHEYGGLAASTAAKQAALAALERHASDQTAVAAPAPADGDATALARALREVLNENRRLLKLGMEVQHRIMRAIAGAARREATKEGYGASGAPARQGPMSAVALIARA